jgi:branched-chain amino acid transport system permease protein
MVVIGGLGTIRGPIFGALLITSLPEILRFAKDYRELVYGLLLVLMVRFMPQGLIGDDSPLWNALTGLWRKVFPKKKTRADLIVESVKGGEQA